MKKAGGKGEVVVGGEGGGQWGRDKDGAVVRHCVFYMIAKDGRSFRHIGGYENKFFFIK